MSTCYLLSEEKNLQLQGTHMKEKEGNVKTAAWHLFSCSYIPEGVPRPRGQVRMRPPQAGHQSKHLATGLTQSDDPWLQRWWGLTQTMKHKQMGSSGNREVLGSQWIERCGEEGLGKGDRLLSKDVPQRCCVSVVGSQLVLYSTRSKIVVSLHRTNPQTPSLNSSIFNTATRYSAWRMLYDCSSSYMIDHYDLTGIIAFLWFKWKVLADFQNNTKVRFYNNASRSIAELWL